MYFLTKKGRDVLLLFTNSDCCVGELWISTTGRSYLLSWLWASSGECAGRILNKFHLFLWEEKHEISPGSVHVVTFREEKQWIHEFWEIASEDSSSWECAGPNLKIYSRFYFWEEKQKIREHIDFEWQFFNSIRQLTMCPLERRL